MTDNDVVLTIDLRDVRDAGACSDGYGCLAMLAGPTGHIVVRRKNLRHFVLLFHRWIGWANQLGFVPRDILRAADLSYANLRGADLGGADLRGADLRSADLGGANLGGANLRGANLCGADLRDADLCGADLCGATMPDGSLNL